MTKNNFKIKLLPIFISVIVLILVQFWALSAEGSSSLSFEISTDKSSFLVGEPVQLNFELTNTGDEDIFSDLFLTFTFDRLRVSISKDGGEFEPYRSIFMEISGMKKQGMLNVVLEGGGGQITASELISFNTLTQNFAFPQPGSYQIKSELVFNHYQDTIESNIVNIIVTEAAGMDGDALSFLEENGLLMFLTPEAQSATERLDMNFINKANEFLVNFPDSIYSDFVRSALASIDEVLMSECPPDTIGIFPECETSEITFDDVITKIETMNLHSGTENSLIVKINSASNNFDKDNTKASLNNLNAFINDVNAQTGKKISNEQAEQLLDCAQQLIDQLSE